MHESRLAAFWKNVRPAQVPIHILSWHVYDTENRIGKVAKPTYKGLLKHEIKKRGPLEHVSAIANLNRKAGHRIEVLAQYHHHLKRHLGHRYHIDPSIDDMEYVRLLSGYNSAIDQNELLNLLHNLSRKSVSEAELVKLASEVARWMDQ